MDERIVVGQSLQMTVDTIIDGLAIEWDFDNPRDIRLNNSKVVSLGTPNENGTLLLDTTGFPPDLNVTFRFVHSRFIFLDVGGSFHTLQGEC